MIRSLMLAVLFVTGYGSPVAADPGNGGRNACRPAEALEQWRPDADASGRWKMLEMERVCRVGPGASQAEVVASVNERDALAASMMPQPLVTAQERARRRRSGGVSDRPEAAAARQTPARPSVRARYGDAEDAREKEEGRAATALLEGGKSAELERDMRRHEEFERRWPAGKEFRECGECPEMVVIPAGKFMMGSPGGELGRYGNEGPRHEVRIGKRFAVGKYEATRAEYEVFAKETSRETAGGCHVFRGKRWRRDGNRSWRDPGYGQTAREPVVCVNRDDARAYAAWLSEKTGKEYRLLSESEWEYVARAGTATRRYWGEDADDTGLCRHANGAGSETSHVWRNKACSDGYRRTAPVGSLGSNGWGLHDVIGNVWEWVEDCLHENYSGAPTEGSAWTSGGDCKSRMLRGGSWLSGSRDLRSALRGRNTAGDRYYDDGFRIARTLTP